MRWLSLGAPACELRPSLTLLSGQNFRFRRTQNANVFAGPVRRSLILLREEKDDTMFAVAAGEHAERPQNAREEIEQLFDLRTNLAGLYKRWAAADSRFADIAPHMQGVRLMRQDPEENTFSFICSSNNNIKRISLMVDFLSKQGPYIGNYEGVAYHSWPDVATLAKLSEETLRSAGFGYRAKFITKTAELLLQKPDGWLTSLRDEDRETVSKELQRLPGVGRKVASCIALMSLDKWDEIPCDTHVLQIAIRDYGLTKPITKTLTDRVANQVGDAFRDIFGAEAGYAQTVLFVADVPDFKKLLPEHLRRDAIQLKPSDLKESAKAKPKAKRKAKGQAGKRKKVTQHRRV